MPVPVHLLDTLLTQMRKSNQNAFKTYNDPTHMVQFHSFSKIFSLKNNEQTETKAAINSWYVN